MRVVLIIDEHVRERAALTRELHKLPSIEVVDASTLHEAAELLEEIEVDLVVSDWELSDGRALALLPRLEREGRPVPALLLGAPAHAALVEPPSSVEILPRPVAPATVREKVAARFGCAPAPFSVTDYLQLASMGHHSVRLELASDGDEIGAIVVRDGQAWSADDPLGKGLDAFTRLLAREDLTVTCSPIGSPVPPRTLEGGCEQLLMRAMTRIDELRGGITPDDEPPRERPPSAAPDVAVPRPARTPAAGTPAAGTPTTGTPTTGTPWIDRASPTIGLTPVPAIASAVISAPQRVVRIPPLGTAPPRTRASGVRLPQVPRSSTGRTAPAARPSALAAALPHVTSAPVGSPSPLSSGAAPEPRFAEGSGPIAVAASEPAEFDRLYELGIEAMLGKRYGEALDAFERAKQIRSTATLEANLVRLRALGAA
ncbi:MAG: DUF4388 domain-containing protein [Kofleriaceae bacterium]